MCLFALTLELETAALDLAIWNPMASWDALPDASKEKALNIYERRYSHKPNHERLPINLNPA